MVRRRVLVGIFITLVIFVIARRVSMNRSEEVAFRHGDVTMRHSTVFEQVGPGQPEILLQVSPPIDVDATVLYRASGKDKLDTMPMTQISSGLWSARLPSGAKGSKLDYGLRISVRETDEGGSPATANYDMGSWKTIKYKGEVSVTVLILHILCMFAAFFFIVEALIGALAMLYRKEGREFTLAQVRWVLLFTFLGGWPLGFALNHQRFGTIWEGFPFGYDITDNKTQLIFIFWLITAVLSWKSFACRRTGSDLAGPRTIAVVVMISSLLSLVLYLVPHSL